MANVPKTDGQLKISYFCSCFLYLIWSKGSNENTSRLPFIVIKLLMNAPNIISPIETEGFFCPSFIINNIIWPPKLKTVMMTPNARGSGWIILVTISHKIIWNWIAHQNKAYLKAFDDYSPYQTWRSIPKLNNRKIIQNKPINWICLLFHWNDETIAILIRNS